VEALLDPSILAAADPQSQQVIVYAGTGNDPAHFETAEIKVTAEDGQTTQVYTVRVYRRGQAGEETGISITFTLENDNSISIISEWDAGAVSLYKDGSVTERTAQVLFSGAPGVVYTGIKWFVDGVEIPGATANTVTLDANDWPLGERILDVLVFRDGKPYSRRTVFEVKSSITEPEGARQ
jgi:hypothetical protein